MFLTVLLAGWEGFLSFSGRSESLLFIIAMILVILAIIKKDSTLIKKASVFTIAGGIVFTVSIMFQYGFLLISPSGFAIPVGIPIIFVIGWWMYQEQFEPGKAGHEITGDEPGPE